MTPAMTITGIQTRVLYTPFEPPVGDSIHLPAGKDIIVVVYCKLSG